MKYRLRALDFVTGRNKPVVVRPHCHPDGHLRLQVNLKEPHQALSKRCQRILHRICMPLCRIAMVVLACLVSGLGTSAAACDHSGGTQSEPPLVVANEPHSPATSRARASSLYETTFIVEASSGHPKDGCPGACPGACCCHGGAASCSAAHTLAQVSSAFELTPRTGTLRTGRKPGQAVRYREPLYGLDRPPKV